MFKRFGDKQDNLRNGKKAKLDEEEYWDDELDEDAIDRAFEIATQQDGMIEHDITYNAFRNPDAFACSTQATTIKTTSSAAFSLKELEQEIKKLKQENLEKEGEIAVLRSKIKQNSNVTQMEQQKTTNEWREKLHITEKEVKAVKSELEFKNLEIVNLKQQLNAKQNMVKKINVEVTLNNSQQFAVPQPVISKLENIAGPSRGNKTVLPIQRRRLIIKEPLYPLKSISPSSFTCTPEDCHLIKSHSYSINRRNTIPYLQNQQSYNEDSFHHKCSKLDDNKKRITLENVYPDILKLINSNSQEINCDSLTESVDKVLCVGLILLKDFKDYLEEYGLHLRTEDIQEADVSYVIQDVNGRSTVSRQLGMEQSKILDIISILLLCNQHIAEFVCRDKLLKLPPSLKKYAVLIPHRNGAVQNNFYFLNLVHGILQNIGKYRLTKQCSFFIKTVIRLLQNITNLNCEVDMNVTISSNHTFNKIFKSIVFSRPDFDIIEKISHVLKSASQSNSLLGFLFNKDVRYELLKAGPKGVLNFNEEVCTFCVFTLLLENYINKTPEVPLQICCNMLSFIYGTFKISHEIHHEMGQKVCSRGCSCVSQLYKLEIDLVYKGLGAFIRRIKRSGSFNKGISEEWIRFLKHETVQKILDQMSFNNLELVEKYVMVFAHFKDVEKALENENLLANVQFNTREELPKISPTTFNKDF